ncbi:MAG: hypothetical protein JXA89_28480 [Anaerolineae bacterium]|nr:hypothetical protein [Anaerolineae bacterium]
MKPAIVMPFHDPDGLMLAHLDTITSRLKRIFGRAFVSITDLTRQQQPELVDRLGQDDFFHLVYPLAHTQVGEQFLALYKTAAATCSPDQLLHLCFIDRIAFALQSDYRARFIQDLQAVTTDETPLLFQRSETAWLTHPQNYREIEHMVTRVGELLFGRSLDFAWCHLVLKTRHLREAVPHITRKDLSVLAEVLVVHRDAVRTRDVDWLAWEDPFICGQNADRLRAERENDVQETLKRLSYVLPKLQVLAEAAGRPSER